MLSWFALADAPVAESMRIVEIASTVSHRGRGAQGFDDCHDLPSKSPQPLLRFILTGGLSLSCEQQVVCALLLAKVDFCFSPPRKLSPQ